MDRIAEKTWLIDLEHLGYVQRIGCGVLEGNNGVALVDPGPTVTVPQLERGLEARGLGIEDIEAILLTHIHLDHAGATGVLVRRNPKIQVYVHDKGAGHMADPEKLVRSATRLYQDNMERFWGEFAPVPRGNIKVLIGNESVYAGGRQLDVVYTPGHAVHHVAYFDTKTGIGFVGDATGERQPNGPYVMPATPPPDISLELIEESLKKIAERKPARLFLTHFGISDDWAQHIEMYRERIAEWSQFVRAAVEKGETESQRAVFADKVSAEMEAAVPRESFGHYGEVGSIHLCWMGLERYWRKRLER